MICDDLNDLDDVAAVLAVVEDSLHVSLLGTIDHDRKGVHRARDRSGEHMRQHVVDVIARLPRHRQLVDIRRKMSLGSIKSERIDKQRKTSMSIVK